MNETEQYPWYGIVSGESMSQGDLLPGCPIVFPISVPEQGGGAAPEIAWERRDVVVMSQSCDMVAGREKLRDVLLCPVIAIDRVVDGHLRTPRGLEEARRGYLPFCHLLAACNLVNHELPVRFVNFREVYSMPLAFVRRHAAAVGSRLRLLPPYREHLAQSFARYFMRVGLPADIPPFK